MDHTDHAVNLFDKFAEKYRDKFMDLTMYEESYREFCDLIPPGSARVLDAACGPGTVTRYLLTKRPELQLLGIDLAPGMIDLAREKVPSARFAVHDFRKLAELNEKFHGIVCAFGLPYISPSDARQFIGQVSQSLERNGIFYLSTMLGDVEESKLERCSTGDEIRVSYYTEDQILGALRESGFKIMWQARLNSPPQASKTTTDLIVISEKC